MLPTHHRRPSPTVFLALAAATLLAACQTSQQTAQVPPYDFPKVSAEWHEDINVTYTGTLQVGRPCSVLRRDDGTEVAIQGKPFPVRIGDRITISGTTARWSLCQTLETIRADKIDVTPGAYRTSAAPGVTVY